MRQLKIAQSITNRTPNVERFFSEIEKIKLISVEREIELTQLIKSGDKQAENELVEANLRFVVSVAKQYQSTGSELNDLINEGCIGLIKAAKKYDETRGFKFISYAVWWIRQSIMEGLNNNGRMIRMPGNQMSLIGKYRDAFSYLEQKLERPPSDEELCEYMDITRNSLHKIVITSSKPISLDVPFKEGENDNTLLDILPNKSELADKQVVNQSIRQAIEIAMDKYLNEKEKRVLKMFFGFDILEPMSLLQIAEEEDCTRENIRQTKDKAILKLKRIGGNKLFKSVY